MGRFGMGQPLKRLEDPRLVTGGGIYTDDVSLPGQAYAFVVRSPHAHADITHFDVAAAREMPGVLAVYTNQDFVKGGLGTIACDLPLRQRDGSPMIVPPRPLFAEGRVRFVGEPITFIVAESLADARDAAEAIEIDYDMLPAIADTAGAVAPGAPRIWDEAPENVAVDWAKGDEASVETLFAQADQIVTLRLINNRLVSNAMEPRNALGVVEDGKLTLYTTSQGVHEIRRAMAQEIFRVPEDQIRVLTGDVGGGFGTKLFPYPEQAAVLFAARELGRPVKWTGDRSDSFLGDAHGRDNVTTASIAMDRDGQFLALKVDTIGNLGAYLSPFGPYVITAAGTGMLPGLYQFKAAYVRVRGVFTNTTATDAYRGAGRPEAAYVIERLVDHAARETGRDPVELRRINFIRPDQLPYTTALGQTYNSGEFATILDLALERADRAGFAARRSAAKARGKLLGLGVASYVEACSGGGLGPKSARIEITPEGGAVLYIGTQTNGQGHLTAYAQIISDALGIEPDRVTMVQGDTDAVATGGGTGGSRSVPVGGAAAQQAAVEIVEKGKRLAAHYLETAEIDIEYGDGAFSVVGTDRRISLGDVAVRAKSGDLPSGETGGLDGTGKFSPPASTYPNGTHVVEIEIDQDTGVPEIVRYTVVDDFGVTVNPLMLAGQVYGGIAQGVGQALYEDCVYDEETGQLLSGSFMDYCMPRADNFPLIDFSTHNVPCKTNPLGVKGAGEAGAIGAPPAVINAIVDALSGYGVEHIDMPATPLKIWQALQAGRTKAAAQ